VAYKNIIRLGNYLHVDIELLKSCVRNERKAQKALYEICFKSLMPICLRYHSNEEDARASLNIGFLKIIQSLSTSNLEELNFGAWCKRIMTNTLIDEYRKTKNHNEHYLGKETDRELDVLSSPSVNDAESNFGCSDIMQLLKEIPKISAHVFNLYVIDGYSHKEIGEKLDMSEGTSKWHLSTARKLLREKLEKIQNNVPQKMVI
jgi:RNA polymerase sigma factor (sigma-70 family)